ncbi:MAG: Ig-like domain-containing protein [Halobacteriota archaeon]
MQDSQLSLGVTSAAVGEPASIRATVSDGNGRPLNGKIIEWFLDGKPLGKSQSRNGTTTLNLTSEYIDNLGSRTHQVQVNFYGDTSYKSSTATSFLLITATGISIAEDRIV